MVVAQSDFSLHNDVQANGAPISAYVFILCLEI